MPASSSGDSSHTSWQPRDRAPSTANGLCGRRLRLRSSATATSWVASQASKKPPRPFTATIWPSRNSSRAWRTMGERVIVPAIPQTPTTRSSPAATTVRTSHMHSVVRESGGPRILILRLALGAHRKGRHRGRSAIVRYVAQDGVPWTAMRAIRKRIAVAPVRRVSKITPTSVAGAGVGDTSANSPASSRLPRIRSPRPLTSTSETVIWAISASAEDHRSAF